jgi:hypothetical protein
MVISIGLKILYSCLYKGWQVAQVVEHLPSKYGALRSSPCTTKKGEKNSCSFLYKKYINHIHLLNFLLLPSSLMCDLFLASICFRSIFHI